MFYDIRPNCEVSHSVNYRGNACYTRFGITSNYSTDKRLDPDGIDENLENIGNFVEYSGSADVLQGKITTTANDTIVYSATEIANNGGILNFTVAEDQEYRIGVCYTTNKEAIDGKTYKAPFIDFGIHVNVNGTGTYEIIRDNVSIEGTHGFETSETFQIVFSRVNQPESNDSSDYHAFLLQGHIPAGGDADYYLNTVARQPMKGGYTPTFILDAPTSGAVVDNIKCIDANDQDQECRSFMTKIHTALGFIGVGGTTFRNSHSYILVNSHELTLNERRGTKNFFNTLGLNEFNETSPGDAPDYKQENTYYASFANVNENKLVIQTKLNSSIELSQIIWNPTDAPSNTDYIEENPPASGNLTPQAKADLKLILPEPYPYLQFHMETLDTISYEGNYFKQDFSRQQNTATRVLMNIPVGDKKQLAEEVGYPETFTVYDYETYTPYYVALNNPEPIPVNQLKCRLATPKNHVISFDNLNETSDAVCMLHFRKSLATDE